MGLLSELPLPVTSCVAARSLKPVSCLALVPPSQVSREDWGRAGVQTTLRGTRYMGHAQN